MDAAENQNTARENGVAVVIAAWRAGATVARAVRSALAQPEAVEVIVVDDASGDEGRTLEQARAADDGTSRLKVIALETNGGPSRARNAALEVSKAPWFCVLDSDDYMEPGRLAVLLKTAQDGYDMIADDLLQLAEGADPETRAPLWFRDRPEQASDLTLESFVRANLPDPKRPRGELGFIKPLIRRALMDQHAVRYDETMRLGEDFDLYARLLAAGARMRLIPAAGYVSVMRAGSLADTRRRTDMAAFVAADDRLLALPGLTAGERDALRSHRHTVNRWVAWIDFVEAMRRGRIDRAVAVMASDAKVAGAILAQGWRTLAGKLLPRSA
ncbi:MAG: glycosyltransferase [Hyphomonadaceae bacterium]